MSKQQHLRNRYMIPGKYVELFGHLLTPYSSDAFRERFEKNVEEDKNARSNIGFRLAKYQKK